MRAASGIPAPLPTRKNRPPQTKNSRPARFYWLAEKSLFFHRPLASPFFCQEIQTYLERLGLSGVHPSGIVAPGLEPR